MRKLTRVFALVGCLVVTSLVADPTLGAEEESLKDLLARWRAFSEPLKELTREERLARVPEFFEGIDVEHLHRLCHECRERGDAEEETVLMNLLQARFRYARPSAEELARFIGDTLAAPSCEMVAVNFSARMREAFSDPDRALLSQAALAAADRPGLTPQKSGAMERAAAALSTTQEVLERVQTYFESDSDSLWLRAVWLTRDTPDDVATDLLLARFDEVVRDVGRHPVSFPAMIIAAATRGQARALGAIEQLLAGDVDWEIRRQAIMALGYIQDPAALRLLLDMYRDQETGIRDETWAITDPQERSFYDNLYRATRMNEAAVIEQLASGESEPARWAFELIDRAVRFGKLVNPDAVIRGLEAYAERVPASEGARVQDVIRRVKAPPDPASRLPSSP